MKQLTPEGIQQINAIASRYNLSQEAVLAMLQAVENGGGSMAQFNIYELGGNGQWMSGGMTMVGDMFNYSLKNTVNNLCQELSNLTANQVIYSNVSPSSTGMRMGSNWWPSELGSPSSSGAQNNVKYAFFPAPVCRLALEINGVISVYNTLSHYISGVSQQQGGDSSVSFTSQFGYVTLASLPLVSTTDGTTQQVPVFTPTPSIDTPKPVENQQANYPQEVAAIEMPTVLPTSLGSSTGSDDIIFTQIERLAGLFQKGVLTEEEFSIKKAELLARL